MTLSQAIAKVEELRPDIGGKAVVGIRTHRYSVCAVLESGGEVDLTNGRYHPVPEARPERFDDVRG